jgi:hypothetical protein
MLGVYIIFTLLSQVQEKGADFSNTLSLLNQLTRDRDNIPPRDRDNIPPRDRDNIPPRDRDNIPPRDRDNIPPRKPDNAEPARAVRKKAVLSKTVGCQTLSKAPVKVLQKAPAALKIRLASLNQQVAVLTKAKNKHAKVTTNIQIFFLSSNKLLGPSFQVNFQISFFLSKEFSQ